MKAKQPSHADVDRAKQVLADLALSLAISEADQLLESRDHNSTPDRRPKPSLLTIPEACAELRISRWSVYRLIQSNQIETVTIGRRRFVPKIVLDDFIEALQRPGADR
ncbi:helix-turn-helix domain-containing protein [Rhodococcus sp. IEGM 1330]|uniref:helix-turn-helix domain-containing protein n=1 Tax=Rhodococcus sp. IEGM 1330 TaxID=3082225 RepID=UPI0029542F24|nr:helix-turn-helix domain-containing protein [Rhodococcus sp. IEGM 1330]MDV8022229.1 helix-turn-helix domain-containing protein [Rhodococcus sp. IEGM 1330]